MNSNILGHGDFFVCLFLCFDSEGKNSLSAAKIAEHDSHQLK